MNKLSAVCKLCIVTVYIPKSLHFDHLNKKIYLIFQSVTLTNEWDRHANLILKLNSSWICSKKRRFIYFVQHIYFIDHWIFIASIIDMFENYRLFAIEWLSMLSNEWSGDASQSLKFRSTLSNASDVSYQWKRTLTDGRSTLLPTGPRRHRQFPIDGVGCAVGNCSHTMKADSFRDNLLLHSKSNIILHANISNNILFSSVETWSTPSITINNFTPCESATLAAWPDALMMDQQLIMMTGLNYVQCDLGLVPEQQCKDKKRSIFIEQIQQPNQDKVSHTHGLIFDFKCWCTCHELPSTELCSLFSGVATTRVFAWCPGHGYPLPKVHLIFLKLWCLSLELKPNCVILLLTHCGQVLISK